MEYFHSIKDSDIFENPIPEPEGYVSRPTVKGIVVDSEGKIAFLSNGEHSLFPGGGVEKEESLEYAFMRECKEEIGCDVKIVSSLGVALQLRAGNERKYEVYFFVADVIGEKGKPTTTEAGELACVLNWFDDRKILQILNDQIKEISLDDYPAHFNCRTHLIAFERYLKMKE